MKRRHSSFTLLEVVVAIAVLAMSLVALLAYAHSSQSRLLRAEERWRHFHMLSQAVEFMMLQGFDEPSLPTEEIFDYPGYQVQFHYDDVEDIPEDLNNLDGQAVLQALTVEIVRESDSKVVDSAIIDRINYDDTGDSD